MMPNLRRLFVCGLLTCTADAGGHTTVKVRPRTFPKHAALDSTTESTAAAATEDDAGRFLQRVLTGLFNDNDDSRRLKTNDWSRSSYPNPEHDPVQCRIAHNSRICDPDGILDAEQVERLAERIDSFEGLTSLRCAEEPAESGGEEEGSPIQLAVALARKMDLSQYLKYGEEAEDHAAQDLAMGLHDDWGVGSTDCGGTGVLVFVSVQDRAVFISTGAGVGSVLTHNRLKGVIENMRPYLRTEEYDNALIECIEDMERLLQSGRPSYWERNGDSILTVSFLAVFFGLASYIHIGSTRERKKYAEAKNQLNKLDRDRALALQGKYRCDSCPICLGDFAPCNEELRPMNASSSNVDAEAGVDESSDMPFVGSDGRPLKLLRCGHVFDDTCWEDWVKSGQGDVKKCPICKQDVCTPQPTKNRDQDGHRRRGATPLMVEDTTADFEAERDFRLHRLAFQYPLYVRHSDVTRWTRPGYTGTLSRDRAFIRNDPARHASSSGSSGHSSGGFGGGSSSGGCGGRW